MRGPSGNASAVYDYNESDEDFDARTQQPTDLWQQAFQALDPEHKQWLDFAEKDESGSASPGAIVSMINNKKIECERRQWVLFTNKKGEKIRLREVLGKICEWAQKFEKIGDTAVEYVVHAAIPWAIIKSLIHMSVNDCQTFGKMFESIEKISSIITLYTDLEARLLIRTSTLTMQFASALVKLYGATLQYLAKTHRYYKQSTMKRVLKSALNTSKDTIDEPMLQIDSLEDMVYKRATIVSQQDGNSMVAHILNIVKQNVTSSRLSMNERRARLSVRINGISTQDTLQAALKYHHEGTCTWILELEAFRDWQAVRTPLSKLLWIHGPPGFGKTILSAWVIQHLKDSGHGLVSYFFCVAENERTRDPYAILRAWVGQILQATDGALEIMEGFFSQLMGDDALTYSELWDLLMTVCRAIPDCTFVLDGFDECTNVTSAAHYHKDDSRSDFLRDLMDTLRQVNVRVLVVSRDVADIREFLNKDSADESGVSMWEYQITAKDTTADVKAFSIHVVDQKLPRKKADLRQQIATEAASRSDGMFLWIQLLEKEISPGQNAKELKAAVRGMPSGISQAYARELEKMDLLPSKDRKKAIMVLRWVLFAIRPLQVKELAEALIVSDGDLDIYPKDDLPDEWEDSFVNEDYVNTIILGFCGSLLRLRSKSHGSPLASHTVHFVHFSVKEYLMSSEQESSWARRLGLADASAEEESLSQICLRYLTLDAFEDMPADTRPYPFLSYAAWAWYFHSYHQKPLPGPGIVIGTKRAFDPTASSWKVWTPVMERKLIEAGRAANISSLAELGDNSTYRSQGSTGSESGSDTTDDELLPEEAALTSDVEEVVARPVLTKDVYLENPIYYASLLGLTDVVDWLADQGLQVDCVGRQFGCPLQAAAARGHTEVVIHLLNRNASVNQLGGEFQTALVAAAALSTLEIVRVLLDAEANVSLCDTDGLTALDHAAKRGATEIVETLLARGAESTAAAKRLALQSGFWDTLKLLKDRGQPLDIVNNEDDLSALDTAMMNFHFDAAIDVIDTLPAAAISAPLGDGSILLHHAAGYGNLDMVRKLVHHLDEHRRSNVNHINKSECTPLHIACAEGNTEIVRLLLGAHATVAPEGLATTPLQLAAAYGHCDVIKILRDAGADLDQRTQGTVTALRMAVESEEEAAVKLLLDLGASMRGIDEDTQSALYSVASELKPTMAELLLSRGCFGAADVNSKTQGTGVDRRLPLLVSWKETQLSEIQLFLAESSKQSIELLRESLRIAAFLGQTAVVDHFVAIMGVSPNTKDMNGRTALHHAAMSDSENHDQICDSLIKAGASLAVEDDIGSTPLDLAIRKGSHGVLFVQKNMSELAKQIIRRPSLLMSPVPDGQANICTSPSQVRNALSGHWEGQYSYLHWLSGRTDPWAADFPGLDAHQESSNASSVGSFLNELRYSSSGEDSVGQFAFHGFVDPVGVVWFAKLYDRHGWLYKGKLSADRKTMKGVWGGNKKLWYGTFMLVRSEAPQSPV